MTDILLDVDGVIADLRQLYLDSCNKANGTSFTRDDMGPEYSLMKALKTTSAQNKNTWELICESGCANTMQALPGAVEGVQRLLRDPRFAVYFVTTPVTTSPTWCYDRRKWINQHFGVCAAEHLVFTSQKHLVRGNIFVDDCIDNVRGWHNAHSRPPHVSVLWDAAEPTNVTPYAPWVCTHDWSIVYALADADAL